MSEYQYYEFTAVDRPLTPEQMSELRDLSTRAEITSHSFTNTYNFGSFRGNPHKLVEHYFDAHIYVSNFGVVRFMLRLPAGVLPEDALSLYSMEYGLTWWTAGARTIVEWSLEDDSSGESMGGEGWMGRLLPIRDELIRGDYRSLYLGWLSCIANGIGSVSDDEEDDEGEADEADDDGEAVESEPPVPAGLASLTGAQKALAKFLEIDSDLITAAAEISKPVVKNGDIDASAAEWVGNLSMQELRAVVVRIVQGEGQRVQTELQSRYFRSRNAPTASDAARVRGTGRTAADLLARAQQMAGERKQRESDKRKRKREAELESLVPRFPELWAAVGALAEEQKSSSYDKICSLLVDMRDAYAHAGRRPEFSAELARFSERHSRRSSLIRRLKDAHLT